MSKQEDLKLLGDPSGKRNAEYWDQWFDIVCKRDHSSFEWYCGSDEVAKVLQYHLKAGERVASNDPRKLQIIHPGSGTSLLPLDLDKYFPGSQHVVLDVSNVALDEMREVHDTHLNSIDKSGSGIKSQIRYELTDVLNPPLQFEESCFDAWIDKGFVDAVFSKETQEDNEKQSKGLFDEANRVLSDNTGVCVVVTLAEKHSLDLILKSWMDESGIWDSILHVWELRPTSGEMLPFGIVLTRKRATRHGNLTLVWHNSNGVEESTSLADGEIEGILTEKIVAARTLFKSSEADKNTKRQILATLEIKPYDADVDMKALGRKVMEQAWFDVGNRPILPSWWSSSADGAKESVPDVKIVDIGYGISKAVLSCVIDSDDLDPLVEAIEEWEGDQDYEGVQSVEIDWENTVPVASAASLFASKAG